MYSAAQCVCHGGQYCFYAGDMSKEKKQYILLFSYLFFADFVSACTTKSIGLKYRNFKPTIWRLWTDFGGIFGKYLDRAHTFAAVYAD